MNKTVFIVIDLTPDFIFFTPETRPPYKPIPLTYYNSFTLNFSVYTRSYTVCQLQNGVYVKMDVIECLIGQPASIGLNRPA